MGWDWLGGLASGILSGLADTGTALINRQSVLDTNAQNERLQREEWGREDTAVQRRMKDLVAAGLNPVLAAGGQGAPTSLTARMEAPAIPMGIGGRAISAALVPQQIARTAADTKAAEWAARRQEILARFDSSVLDDPKVVEAEKQRREQEAIAALWRSDKEMAEAMLARTNADVAAHDWKIIDATGVLSNTGGLMRDTLSAAGLTNQIIEAVRRKFFAPGKAYD